MSTLVLVPTGKLQQYSKYIITYSYIQIFNGMACLSMTMSMGDNSRGFSTVGFCQCSVHHHEWCVSITKIGRSNLQLRLSSKSLLSCLIIYSLFSWISWPLQLNIFKYTSQILAHQPSPSWTRLSTYLLGLKRIIILHFRPLTVIPMDSTMSNCGVHVFKWNKTDR